MLSNIKILADENISPRLVIFLRENGIDVLNTKEQGWYGREDEELLNIAFSEGRFILTHDSDFGTLAVHEYKRYHGIIYMRLKNIHPENVIKVMQRLLKVEVDFRPGSLIVVEEARIRFRQLDDDTQ